MRQIPILLAEPIAPSIQQSVAAALGQLETLGAVLAWARAQEPPVAVLEIVTQDEYTHDVVLPFGGAHFVVLDAT